MIVSLKITSDPSELRAFICVTFIPLGKNILVIQKVMVLLALALAFFYQKYCCSQRGIGVCFLYDSVTAHCFLLFASSLFVQFRILLNVFNLSSVFVFFVIYS